ncbi:hypothetical protein [Neorhizobium petrolearium]|uniref:hypothetical protein n=1 Tax=Neorhizobium petrolearium TaxID=515361 RepID=UPI003F13F296
MPEGIHPSIFLIAAFDDPKADPSAASAKMPIRYPIAYRAARSNQAFASRSYATGIRPLKTTGNPRFFIIGVTISY